jgi:hypothetical protein
MRWQAAGRAVAVLALLTLTTPTTTPAAADPTPTPSALPPESPLQVVVTTLLPRAPQPDDAVEVQGFIRNVGTQPVTRMVVRLRVGDRVRTRGGLHEADTDRPLTTYRANTTVELGSLSPDAQVRFDIRTDVNALGLSGLGVYPLDVEARGNVGGGSERLGLTPTWLPFFGGDPVQRTRVAVVWPLVDEPRQDVDTTLRDDELATSLSSQGRLGRLLAAARAAEVRDCQGPAHKRNGTVTPAPTRCETTHVTYAVDPDLLFAASTMTSPYKVRAGSKTVPGTGEAAATAWVASMREGAARSKVLALPYADPDITALTRSGGFNDDVARAALLAVTEVRDTLSVEPLENAAWPPAGPVTSAATDALALVGARAFVLDPSAYGQPDSEPDRTPSARTVLSTSSAGTTLEGLVTDTYLSDLVAGGLAQDLGPRIAEQRFLAETAIIAAEAPGLSRTLVIAPERRGDVVVGAAAAALRDLGRVPWLCPVSLAAVAAGNERCAGRPGVKSPAPVDRGPLSTARTGELPQAYLYGIGQDRDQASQLTDAVLSDRPAVQQQVAAIKTRLRRAVARAESSAWRIHPAVGRATAAALHREVRKLVDKIRVYGGQVLLTSTSGTLQVSLENRLDVPVVVKVGFEAPGDALVRTETGLIEVTPGNAVPASVHAVTQKSGQFVVTAQIYDREGKPFNPGPPGMASGTAEVIVRSTGYGRLALAVTAGGAGVLLVAAGVRIVRRALSSTPPPP